MTAVATGGSAAVSLGGSAAVEPLDLASAGLIVDPYPAYAALRAGGGLHHSPRWGSWLVTSYGLGHEVFSRTDSFDAVGQPFLRALQAAVRGGAGSWRAPPAPQVTAEQLAQRAEGRRTTGRALGVEFVDTLWPAFDTSCRKAAARLAGGAQTGPVDLVADYAIPLTTELLAALMAVEPDDLPAFAAWAESGYHPELDDEARRAIVRNIRGVLGRQAAGRLRCPVDDFVGHLAANPGAMPGAASPLTAHLEFVLGTGLMISLVTHQGLVLSFSTLMNALLTRPDQYALLRADHGLLAGAVEEGLRFDTSTQALGRLARRDTTLAGTAIDAGSLVVVFVGSANRDETRWPDADRFDITRDLRRSARHLAFGHGATSCLGASMSRRALRHLLGAIVERFPALAPAAGAELFGEFVTRGFTKLPARSLVA